METTTNPEAKMTAAQTAAQYDRYIASVKAPFLALPDTDENWNAMLAVVAAARAQYARQIRENRQSFLDGFDLASEAR